MDDKVAFYRECLRHRLSTVEILGVLTAGPETPLDDAIPPQVRSFGQFQQLLDAHPDGLFVKPRAGSHGEGAFPILPDSGGWRFPAGLGTSRAVFDYSVSCARSGTLLLQPRLVTPGSLCQVMAPNGFGTVRAVTYMHDQRPTLVAALLRIVVEGNAADNFSHGTSGNLLASIDPATGTLTAVRGSRSRTWPSIVDLHTHPATGIGLVGFRVPHWWELLDLILRAQTAFGQLRTIGWDVGITQEGPLLVEANSLYDFDLMQVAFDRGFAPDFRRIVEATRRSPAA